MLLGIFFYALYTVLVNKRPQIHPLSFLTIIIAVGVVFLFPLYLLERHFSAPLELNCNVLLSIGYVAIFPSILAYLCWNYGIGRLGANRAGLYVNLVPLFASLMAITFLGELLQEYHLLGTLFIFSGIVMFNLPPSKKKRQGHQLPVDRNRIEAILFDLDGTLLQVEMHKYIPAYVAALADRLSDQTDVDKTADAIFSAISALIRREEGHNSNETFFLHYVADHLELDVMLVESRFNEFYTGDLSSLDTLMQPLELARTLIEQSQARGLEVIIATNPVFPKAVVESRLVRAGLSDFDFHLVTCFENSRRCKPNPDYFIDILTHLNLKADNCLMVGNDSMHDLAAGEVGIPTFLVDTWLIDRSRGNFTTDFRGDHIALLDFIMTIGKRR
jgi:FMN phosphatase YigB (HAD superfamily)